jgi:acyl-CoA thioesterase FadM
MLQDVAVEGSRLAGWSPDRFRKHDIAFVVRSQTVSHHREVRYGVPLEATTWVSTFRRGLITNREIRIRDPDGPVVSATQEWVHVKAGKPARAGAEVVDAFPIEEIEPSVQLPQWSPRDGPVFSASLSTWHVTMDPLGHANHPAYVDWCDEALARRWHENGQNPVNIVPVAERVTYRGGVVAPEIVDVSSQVVGTLVGAEVMETTLKVGDRVAAKATTIRGSI